MTKDFYRQALFALRVERETLVEKLNEIDKERRRIAEDLERLDEVRSGLAALAGEPDAETQKARLKLEGLSLADACREVLKVNDRYMSPIRVRIGLKLADYDTSPYSNILASIHAILKRFADSGEVEKLNVDGKIGYRWIWKEGEDVPAPEATKRRKRIARKKES